MKIDYMYMTVKKGNRRLMVPLKTMVVKKHSGLDIKITFKNNAAEEIKKFLGIEDEETIIEVNK